ncbi:hypothetical protein SUGI_0496140 [Cryptomeria japonica]|nr:hypothetical protein SUGI_0496140 [Cryptomeria japonica]
MGFHGMLLLSVINVLLGQTVCECFSFPNFNEAPNNLFIFNNSDIAFGALQVTQETQNTDPRYSMANRSGRVIYNNAYKFWREDGFPVSFNTTFVLNIQVPNGTGGGGMAFIISSNKNVNDIPANSYGLWMGLFNSAINGLSSNEMVAVEFDTRKNNGTNDPDGNHIGINVNSINSTKIESLAGSQIDLKSGNDITVWIQFNGVQQQLQVYMANGSSPMPLQPLLSVTLNLSGVLGSKVHFGFSASTSESIELNCVKSWNLTIEPVTSSSRRALTIAVSGVACALFIAALVGIVLICIKYRKSRAEAAEVKQMLLREMPPPWVPPFRPSFIWPYPMSEDSSSISLENSSPQSFFMQSPAVR